MTVTKQVEHILSVSHRARNSDKELLILYMQKYGMNLTDNQILKFRDMPSPETIRRVRQKIQESGRYQADQKIKSERDWKSLRMQQNAPSASPRTVEQIILPWGQG